MANEFSTHRHSVEEEYFEFDLTSAAFLCCHAPSPNRREFEFLFAVDPPHRKTTVSPADEIFYSGKLLALHRLECLEMPQKLLHSSANMYGLEKPPSNATTLPYKSCNISPATSCYNSDQPNSEAYFHKFAAKSHQKKPWAKTLKIVKQSWLKINALRAYFKSLITKNLRAQESTMANQAKEVNSQAKVQDKSHLANNNAVAIKKAGGQELADDFTHRKSHSLAILRHQTCKSSSTTSPCSTSSSSFSRVNSNPRMLQRCSSMKSEMENSILGAIAYCKMSQQVYSRKSSSEIALCSLSSDRITASYDNLEQHGIR